MRSKIGEFLQSLFFRLYLVTAAAVFALVLLLRDRVDFHYKSSQLAPTWSLFLLALLAAVLISLLIRVLRNRLKAPVHPALFFLLLFFVQVYICYNCYSRSTWDVEQVIYYSRILADGFREEWYTFYFQKYMNNTFLAWFFSLVIRIDRYIGVLDVEPDSYMALLTVQCLLSSLAGYLIYRTALRLWNDSCAAWGAALLFVLLAGLSPWLMVPYSDSMGILIPILVLWLYSSVRNSRHPALKWAAIGAAAYWGYRIKPQCMICVIAIVLIEGAELLRSRKEQLALFRRFRSAAAFLAAVCVSALVFSQVILPYMHIERNRNFEFGPTHFFMMGLSDESDGGYHWDDVEFSGGIWDADERAKAELQVAAQRIRDYGPLGLLRHIGRKTLVNFGDGSFAWQVEGLSAADSEPKNRFISPLLRNYFYKEGEYVELFLTWAQTVWLFTLFAPLGLFCLKRRDLDKETLALMLSVFGLTLFETLFEARARYLFTYTPYFVLLAAAGWRCGRQKLRTLRQKAI